MKDCKINILGTEYDFSVGYEDKTADGISRFYNKKISVRPIENLLDSESTEEEKILRQKECARHEIFHCALFEGTGADYAWDENLVGFLAVNSPKIFKIFQEMDLL